MPVDHPLSDRIGRHPEHRTMAVLCNPDSATGLPLCACGPGGMVFT